MAFGFLTRLSTSAKDGAKQMASRLQAKMHQYQFSNELEQPVRILLEEDPEGMLQAARDELDDGIPVVGERAKRRAAEIEEAHKVILETTKRFQEFTVIHEQLKTVQMRSPIIRCSIAVCSWDGQLIVTTLRMKMAPSGLAFRITRKLLQGGTKTLCADTLEDAMLSFGIDVGFERKESDTEPNSEPEVQQSPTSANKQSPLPQQPQQPAPLVSMAQQPGMQQMQRPSQVQSPQQPQHFRPQTMADSSQQPQQQTQHVTQQSQHHHSQQQQQLQVKQWQQPGMHLMPHIQQQQQQQQQMRPLQPTPPPLPRPRSGHSAGATPRRKPPSTGFGLQSGGAAPLTHRRDGAPSGLVATEASVQVYSSSRQQWLPGVVIGIGLGIDDSIPAGSVCVQYEAAPSQYTQKIILPAKFSEMLRMP
eukprot:TRINITY_DN1713_c0_g1_i1.p1 TRINITY_DN1713_c0_g1~~TRINITY_DN1713_c0_g1_i1.p1  ORF type:complete len:418 (-),score=88.17 TRINITY_DN1713_c0_g1_i1:99-1352(-)